jgi:DNA helicase HerA-like ATPase
MTLSHPERRITLSEKQYILGRKEKMSGGVLHIGAYYALDGSLGAPVFLDVLRPHVVFICGKRGYGKSYTIGVFLEEIASLEESVRQELGVVVVDTLGIYWTTRCPSKESSEKITLWGRSPEGFTIRLLVPGSAREEYEKRGISTDRFSLRVAELSPMHWYQLFDVKATDAVGIVLTRAVLALQSSSHYFSIAEILTYIQQDERVGDEVKGAVENLFLMVESWGVFEREGLSVTDLVQRGTLTILDLSHFQSSVLKDIMVSLVSKKIFEERVKERKVYELKKMGQVIEEQGIPLVWLAVDEAQVFLPSEKKTLSKEVLINEWMRQGRQPGLSLIMATQRPSAVEPEVLSHSDIILCHRLTAQEDIDALSRIRPTFMQGDIRDSIKKIGAEKGVALLIDDTSETIHVIRIRPRMSWHGGSEPVITGGQ